ILRSDETKKLFGKYAQHESDLDYEAKDCEFLKDKYPLAFETLHQIGIADKYPAFTQALYELKCETGSGEDFHLADDMTETSLKDKYPEAWSALQAADFADNFPEFLGELAMLKVPMMDVED